MFTKFVVRRRGLCQMQPATLNHEDFVTVGSVNVS